MWKLALHARTLGVERPAGCNALVPGFVWLRLPGSLPGAMTAIAGSQSRQVARRRRHRRHRRRAGPAARDLLAPRYFGGAVRTTERAYGLFGEGESSVASALPYVNGFRQVPGSIADAVEFISRKPKLRARLRQPRPAAQGRLTRPAGRAGGLHRGLQPEGELAQAMDRIRARVRVRPAGAERG